jgi:EAL domain-containing protein (putative c-di-GMP-specific phosphodiesterase class I)
VLLLELTESALMVDDDVARAQICGLRDLGVRLALDDFGTGWSSLEYLSRVPVDVLKIAQVFIDQIGTSTRATALVRAIVDLAHSLGLITVAEGVERAEQAERLRQMGCFLGQGWYFARELDVEQATASLKGLAGGRQG